MFNPQSAIHKDLPAETLIYSISVKGRMGRKEEGGAGSALVAERSDAYKALMQSGAMLKGREK